MLLAHGAVLLADGALAWAGGAATPSQRKTSTASLSDSEAFAEKEADGTTEREGSSCSGQGKIQVACIYVENAGYATTEQRTSRLMVEVIELSIRCDCEIALVPFNSQGKLTQYASNNIDQTFSEFDDATPAESYTNASVSSCAFVIFSEHLFIFLFVYAKHTRTILLHVLDATLAESYANALWSCMCFLMSECRSLNFPCVHFPVFCCFCLHYD